MAKITIPLNDKSYLSKDYYYIKNKVYYRIIEFFGIKADTMLQLEFYKEKKWHKETYLIEKKEFVKQFKRIKK
jgi:hypothetical protein